MDYADKDAASVKRGRAVLNRYLNGKRNDLDDADVSSA